MGYRYTCNLAQCREIIRRSGAKTIDELDRAVIAAGFRIEKLS